MTRPNYKRMMEIIDEVFDTRNDPGQLQVTPAQLKKLEKIHPSTLTELCDENGPVIWVLLIPTTRQVMDDFLKGRITEKEILDRTQPGIPYDCIYLCSVTTLPEYRGKGKTKTLCLEAIRAIAGEHPVTTLFAWPFTAGGTGLAHSLAGACNMKLKLREPH